jgi:hypothetical protein
MPVLEDGSATTTTAGEGIELQERSYGLQQMSPMFSLFAIWDQRLPSRERFSFQLSGTWSGKETAGSAYLNATEHV